MGAIDEGILDLNDYAFVAIIRPVAVCELHLVVCMCSYVTEFFLGVIAPV